MNVFSMDESGFTGHDLLQKSQPFQGASAISISEDDAAYLIRQHFPKRQAQELKFSSLKRRESNQKPLFNLQRELLANFPSVTCVADKRFLLTLMFIEYAVEPFYYDNGINLYEDGGNIMMASMTYYVAAAYFGSGFDEILRAFQNAVDQKTPEAVNKLIDSVRAIDWRQLSEVFGPLALRHESCVDAIMYPQINTDAAFVLLQALISRTELMSEGPYSIKHDRSKNLLKYNEYLNMLIGCTTEATFKHSEIASITYPLKLTDVSQVDSKDSSSVQLCDVLVGGAIAGVHDLRQNKPMSFYSPLKLYNGNQIIHFFPDVDFAAQKEFRKGSQASEYIDFVQNNFLKAKM